MAEARRKTGEDRLADLFRGEEELDTVTLGYPDFSGGAVTAKLRTYTTEDLKIIQRYAELHCVGFLPHVNFLTGLIAGLHQRDPAKQFPGAIELAREQIEGSREHFRVLTNCDFLPILARKKDEDLPEDAWNVGWCWYRTEDDKLWLRDHADILDVISQLLTDPITTGAEFHEATNSTIGMVVLMLMKSRLLNNS